VNVVNLASSSGDRIRVSVRTAVESNGLRRTVVRNVHDIIDMIAHCHKQIKKQFASSHFHLHLHSSTSLESLATPDDQCQKVRAQFGILFGSVFVCKPSGPEDHFNRDSHLQTLLPKRQALQFFKAEFIGAAVDDGVFEKDTAHSVVVDCRLYRSATVTILGVLQLPGVASLVMEESGIVVPLV
jgi:hypothetical protein